MAGNFLALRRIEVGLTQTDIANELGYTVQSISQWENGKHEPNILIWSKYAALLEIDLEGFLFEKVKKDNDFCCSMMFDTNKFANNLRYLRKKNRYLQTDIAKLISASNKTVVAIEKGLSLPTKKQFISLCNLYKLTTDELYFAMIFSPAFKETRNKKRILLPILIPVVICVAAGGTGAGVAIHQHNLKMHGDVSASQSSNSMDLPIDNLEESTDIEDASIDIGQNGEGQPSVDDSSELETPLGELIIDGKICKYGSYPNSIVSDSNLIEELEKNTPDEHGYYQYNDHYYFKDVALTPATESTMDLMHNIIFSDNTPIVAGNYYWFNVEPITWKIIYETENDYLLFSEYTLDRSIYDETSNNYKESFIRSFINNDFYDKAFAFDDSLVTISEVDNSLSSTCDDENDYVCENTFDKVFLPSNSDLTNEEYGYTYKIDDNVASLTDYGKLKAITCNTKLSRSCYWTRTPDYYSSVAADALMGAAIYGDAVYINLSEGNSDLFVGIRPMIRVKK